MSETAQKPLWTQKTPFTDEQILWFLEDNIADSLAGSQMKGHAQSTSPASRWSKSGRSGDLRSPVPGSLGP